MEKLFFLVMICTSVHAQKVKSLDTITYSQSQNVAFTKEFKIQAVDDSYQMSDGTWIKNGAILVNGKPSTMNKTASGNNAILIGAFNVPRGSVRVMAGGRQMQEGVDYTVNYQAGTVQVLDPSLEASKVPIIISF